MKNVYQRVVFSMVSMVMLTSFLQAKVMYATELNVAHLEENYIITEEAKETDIESDEELETLQSNVSVVQASSLTTNSEVSLLIESAVFPDQVFMEYVKRFDKDGNGVLNAFELATITSIEVPGKAIVSLQGIEHFSNLKYLNCMNTNITKLDVSLNKALEKLYCTYSSELIQLNVSGATALTILDCSETKIEVLDVSNNTELEYLLCENSKMLRSLNVAGAKSLYSLDVSGTSVAKIDISNNLGLVKLDCYNTKITELDVTKNTALEDLFCGKTVITDLDISNNKKLLKLEFSDTRINGLDISLNDNLHLLDCDYSTPLAWLYIGEQATEERYFPKPIIDIGTVEDEFDIKNMFLGIEPDRIISMSGAKVNAAGIVSGYKNGTPIVYQYDCGNDNGEVAILTVKLLFEMVDTMKPQPKPDTEGLNNKYTEKNNNSAPNTNDNSKTNLFLVLSFSSISIIIVIRQKNASK